MFPAVACNQTGHRGAQHNPRKYSSSLLHMPATSVITSRLHCAISKVPADIGSSAVCLLVVCAQSDEPGRQLLAMGQAG